MMYLWLVVGFVCLIKGADFFVEGSSSIATILKIPSIIIGLTIIAMGTSAPETAVSITSSLSGANGIAVGNVIGSNFFNLLVVVGICSFMQPMKITDDLLKRDYPFSIVATVLLGAFLGIGFFFMGGPTLNRPEGIVLLVFFVAYLAILIRSALSARKGANDDDEVVVHHHSVPASLGLIAIGLVGIIIGGDLVVNNASLIAKAFGMSDTLIGLTIVAMGTSLPELVTSIVASKKGENDMAMGNVIGSNIFNILLVLGIAGTVSPIHLGNADTFIDCGILLAVNLVVLLMVLKKRIVDKKVGIAMLLMYVAYTAYIFYRNYFIH